MLTPKPVCRIGVGGHAVHGGFGPHTRLWGALLDNIVELDVVLADGTITKANSKLNSDLFWVRYPHLALVQFPPWLTTN